MPLFVRFALAAVLALFLAAPAAAVQPRGSAGWTNDGWTNNEASLYRGPGPRYTEIGTVGGGLRIRVDRCSGLWCEIHAPNLHGRMALANISFGQYPWHLFDGRPRFPVHAGGPVCFYSGTNFTGVETCLGAGHVIRDLALAGLDNSFRSVKIVAGSALVCRDRNFRSRCVIINRDEPHLEVLLDHAISSIHVY